MLSYDKRPTYYVILAGGSGERLWPFSREQWPKQFLAIADETLIEQAVSRLAGLIGPGDRIWVSTVSDHYEKIKQYVGDKVHAIITEPARRNTAPAILYALLLIEQENPNALVFFLPADSFIPEKDYALFRQTLIDTALTIEQNPVIALIGIKPASPATGYGYIEYDPLCKIAHLYKVFHFHEKPGYEVAKRYIQSSSMLWNSGICGARVSLFLEEFKVHAPEIFSSVHSFCIKNGSYESAPSLSIDYALMEKSEHVAVFPAEFSWSDVGSLAVFLDLKKKKKSGLDEKDEKNKIIEIDSLNNLIDVPDKLVVLIGVENFCVIETDDTLLITKIDDVEKVRSVVAHLRAQSDLRHYL